MCIQFVMRFEWDEDKNRLNKAKHKISFGLALEVFADPLAQFILDRVVDGEERWKAIGQIRQRFLIVTIHCYRQKNGEEVIRIISARPASSHERKLYEEG